MHSTDIEGLSDWHDWSSAAVSDAPKTPGIYVLRLQGATCGRLMGSSDVLYVGTTAKGTSGLRGRLKQHCSVRDQRHWLHRVLSGIGAVQVAWNSLPGHPEAEIRESNLLARYAIDHIELPPGNCQQPAKKLQQILYLVSTLSSDDRALLSECPLLHKRR